MKTRLQSIKGLKKKADKLYQIRLIEQKPVSIISGQATEVIHHFIRKSQSANLRYDYANGVPLTNKEHCQHHLSGDPSIVADIIKAYGREWYEDLQTRRRIDFKMNKTTLKEVIEKLSVVIG